MRPFSVITLALLSSQVLADTSYLGLYMQGKKIGYSSFAASKSTHAGKPAQKSESKTVMNLGLLGQEMSVKIDSSTWTSMSGTPLRMLVRQESMGRVQTVDASLRANKIFAKIDNAGTKTTKTIIVPKGQKLVDDPLAAVMTGKLKPGASRSFLILDAATVTLVKNEVKVVGPTKTTVNGKSLSATLVEIVDPRVNTKVFLSSKGDVIKVEGPMGIEMLPVTRAVALRKSEKYTPTVDLAFSTSLRTDKPIDDPRSVTGLKMKVSGRDLSVLPSDEHQTVSKDGSAWIIEVHPPRLDDGSSASIADAAKQKPEWLQPSLHIPSNSARFRTLAKTIVGDKTDVLSASSEIRRWVYRNMQPNAGIGVLRDANDVLTSKEGVCRDYAILTATLLRAAGIPARVSSGLVNWDGTFYYHAWAEAWDGSRWIGLDSTAEPDQITATHVKLADGNVEEAFVFTFLDKVKLEVLDIRRK